MTVRHSRFDLCQKFRIRIFTSIDGLLALLVPCIVTAAGVSAQLEVGLEAVVKEFSAAYSIGPTLR